MLFRNAVHSMPLSVLPFDPTQCPLGKVCFSFNKGMNSRITAFQDNMVSIPAATSYWNSYVSDIDLKKVWSLTQKFLLTNKIK